MRIAIMLLCIMAVCATAQGAMDMAANPDAAAAASLLCDIQPLTTGDLTDDNQSLADMGFTASFSSAGLLDKSLWPGDANGDGIVDVGDLGILGWQYHTESGKTWSQADFTGEGLVDEVDLGILSANYGLPEPGTVALLTAGLLVLGRRHRW